MELFPKNIYFRILASGSDAVVDADTGKVVAIVPNRPPTEEDLKDMAADMAALEADLAMEQRALGGRY